MEHRQKVYDFYGRNKLLVSKVDIAILTIFDEQVSFNFKMVKQLRGRLYRQ